LEDSRRGEFGNNTVLSGRGNVILNYGILGKTYWVTSFLNGKNYWKHCYSSRTKTGTRPEATRKNRNRKRSYPCWEGYTFRTLEYSRHLQNYLGIGGIDFKEGRSPIRQLGLKKGVWNPPLGDWVILGVGKWVPTEGLWTVVKVLHPKVR